eukprot:GHVU01036589.1.p3 GENE.GHVU01036589.1~~GHVU01036589.1.p3  ORF type:complete len:115 (-),score=26.76 GHVU01036589.1:508-852(-)
MRIIHESDQLMDQWQCRTREAEEESTGEGGEARESRKQRATTRLLEGTHLDPLVRPTWHEGMKQRKKETEKEKEVEGCHQGSKGSSKRNKGREIESCVAGETTDETITSKIEKH